MTSLSHAGISNPTIRMLSILSLLTSASPRRLGLTEISDRLEMPKATCGLIISELWAAGYLDRDAANKRYGVGPRAAFAPGPGLFGEAPEAGLHDGLAELSGRLGVPLSLLQVSSRSSVVVSTFRPCSELARLGRRRPLVAPFGASFVAFACEAQRAAWIETGLRDAAGDVSVQRTLLEQRLSGIREQGWEAVHQVEEDILAAGYRNGCWFGDLFDLDALMHSYRRKLLEPAVLQARPEDGEVSRIVLPLWADSGEVRQCVEFWLQGRIQGLAELSDCVSKWRQDLAGLAPMQ